MELGSEGEGLNWKGRETGTRDYMMISKTSISCRLSRPPIEAFTFSQKLSAGCQPEKKAKNPGRQFFFLADSPLFPLKISHLRKRLFF